MGFIQWPSKNIKAIYHLNDVNDSSGNSLTLTNNNTVTFVNGKFGNCAEFGASNTNKYLSRSAVGIDLGGNAAISFWTLIETAPNSGESQGFFWWASTTGTARVIYFIYSNISGTKKLILSAGGTETQYTITLDINKWMKFDVVIGSTCYIYLNGAFLFSGSRGTGISSFNFLNLGYSYSGNPFKGRLDEVILFNNTLTEKNITQRYIFEKGFFV